MEEFWNFEKNDVMLVHFASFWVPGVKRSEISTIDLYSNSSPLVLFFCSFNSTFLIFFYCFSSKIFPTIFLILGYFLSRLREFSTIPTSKSKDSIAGWWEGSKSKWCVNGLTNCFIIHFRWFFFISPSKPKWRNLSLFWRYLEIFVKKFLCLG